MLSPTNKVDAATTSVAATENSHITYTRILQAFVEEGDRWLDLGCGHALVPDWIQAPPQLFGRAIGLDRDFAALKGHKGLRQKVRGDAHVLPFAADVFDAISANMVLEHIAEPAEFFSEISRVLRPGGRLLIHTPNAAGYTTRLARLVPEHLKPVLAVVLQRRAAVDVYPAFYRANTRHDLARAATRAHLTMVSCDFVMTSPQLLKVPIVRSLERLWMRRLARSRAESRPVLIASFEKTRL